MKQALTAEADYPSKVYRDKANTHTVPAYAVADFRAERPFACFILFGEVENLFDKTHCNTDGLWRPPAPG